MTVKIWMACVVPIIETQRARRISLPIAPSIPKVVVIPEIKAKSLRGNQSAAIFNTATKANAEPKPLKIRRNVLNEGC